jgi:hypothetical protein
VTDGQWNAIKHLLPGQEGDPGATAKDNRLFVNAVMWIAKMPSSKSSSLRRSRLKLAAELPGVRLFIVGDSLDSHPVVLTFAIRF